MYYRRKLLLAILERSKHKKLSKINLQKVLFLVGKEQKQPYFDFVPYKYGCCSFQANKDLEVLSRHFAVIENREEEWSLKPNQNYFEELNGEDKTIIRKIFETLDLDTANLIKLVDDDDSYFTINSERKLTVSQEEKRQQEKEKIRNDKKRLFSIGYEKKSIDGYLNLLVKNNIKLLCDVRKNPFSMKYGFSKNQLRGYCAKLHIEYIHIPDLGIKSGLRKNLKTKEDYESLFRYYQKELIKRQENLKYLKEVFKKYNRMALTCFERDHNYCHRKTLIDYYNKRVEKVSPIHLYTCERKNFNTC